MSAETVTIPKHRLHMRLRRWYCTNWRGHVWDIARPASCPPHEFCSYCGKRKAA